MGNRSFRSKFPSTLVVSRPEVDGGIRPNINITTDPKGLFRVCAAAEQREEEHTNMEEGGNLFWPAGRAKEMRGPGTVPGILLSQRDHRLFFRYGALLCTVAAKPKNTIRTERRLIFSEVLKVRYADVFLKRTPQRNGSFVFSRMGMDVDVCTRLTWYRSVHGF